MNKKTIYVDVDVDTSVNVPITIDYNDVIDALNKDDVIELMDHFNIGVEKKHIDFCDMNPMQRKEFFCDLFGVSHHTPNQKLMALIFNSF
jgi:hypothetical protein